MLKILRIIFLLALYFKATFAKNSEFEIGVGVSMANYHIDTAAHSILNWQHLKSYDLKLATRLNLDRTSKFILELNYSHFNKGEMSDDDIENYEVYGPMIYSKTRYFEGYSVKIDGLLQGNINRNLDLLFGARYDRKIYRPKGIYQLVEYPPAPRFLFQNNRQIQHIDIETYGPTLGFSLTKPSSDMKIKLTVLGYVPVTTNAITSNWGREGGIEKSPKWEGALFDTLGVDVKLESMFKITDSNWVNLYTVFEYMKSTELKETVFGVESGKSNQNIHKKVSFGISMIL
jgi:hypothetical protein